MARESSHVEAWGQVTVSVQSTCAEVLLFGCAVAAVAVLKGKIRKRSKTATVFRSTKGDRYVAIAVPVKDLHATDNGDYPHKIGFRAGKVLYECDRFGREVLSHAANAKRAGRAG